MRRLVMMTVFYIKWANKPWFIAIPAMTYASGRYITMPTDFGSSQFPDDEARDDPRNVGLLVIQPTDAAASPRIFYWNVYFSL